MELIAGTRPKSEKARAIKVTHVVRWAVSQTVHLRKGVRPCPGDPCTSASLLCHWLSPHATGSRSPPRACLHLCDRFSNCSHTSGTRLVHAAMLLLLQVMQPARQQAWQGQA